MSLLKFRKKQINQNSYDELINKYSTSESSINHEKINYQSIIQDYQAYKSNNLDMYSKNEQSVNDLLLSKDIPSIQVDDNHRNNPQLTNTARFSKKTLQLLYLIQFIKIFNSLGEKQNSNINELNINYNIRLSLLFKKIILFH